MKTFKRVVLLLLVLLIIFIAHVLISTGFFRSITPHFDGTIRAQIQLKGAEDLTISPLDSFVIISSTDRTLDISEQQMSGGLFLIDLKSDDFNPIPLTEDFKQPFAPHGLSIFQMDSSYQVMVINHTTAGHSIEVFELREQTLRHIRTLRNETMIRPNDLVIVDEDKFYFTNDHGYDAGIGKFLEEYGGLAVSNVVYFNSKDFKEAANGIAYANGINYDKNRNLMYVSSPRGFEVKVYQVQNDGALTFIENIPCGTGVDNIEFDDEMNLWIGCHPNLLRFASYAKGKKQTSPSEIIKITYINTGDFSVDKIYVSDGKDMSGSSVAAPWDNLIFTGNVADRHILVLEKKL